MSWNAINILHKIVEWYKMYPPPSTSHQKAPPPPMHIPKFYTQMKDAYTTNYYYLAYTFILKRFRECN